VKNGDRWRVLDVSNDGALLVQHLRHHARTRLPAANVERDVEFAYAGTAHRVQGDTVDTAHVLVTDDTTREACTSWPAVPDTEQCCAWPPRRCSMSMPTSPAVPQ